MFIGGTSIFGGKGTIVGSFFGAFIIIMIEAGLVATGIQGFWVRAVVGIVFLAAVIFHLTMEDPARLRRLRHSASPAGSGASPPHRRGSSLSGHLAQALRLTGRRRQIALAAETARQPAARMHGRLGTEPTAASSR